MLIPLPWMALLWDQNTRQMMSPIFLFYFHIAFQIKVEYLLELMLALLVFIVVSWGVTSLHTLRVLRSIWQSK